METSGLTKLIYSTTFDSSIDVGMRIVEDPRQLTKSASTIFGCDYSDIKPDADHVGVHVVALGAFERYGSNRNADSFPKAACVAYHPTFVKNGHVYRHHRNKDPEKRLGQIVKSAYNPDMDRVELFIHAHKEKASDELQKLAEHGEVPLSMACRVPFDRCSICNTLRKTSSDPNQCSHVLTKLGQVLEDGRIVCTHNDEPTFFDISFVGRPADRIAWNLKVAAAGVVDSVKLAELEDLLVPDSVMLTSPDSLAKYDLMKKLAVAVDTQRAARADTGWWPILQKTAAAKPSTEQVVALRDHLPEDMLLGLAKVGAILDVDSFLRYAMGPRYDEVAPYGEQIKLAVAGHYRQLLDGDRAWRVCNESLFDVDSTRLVGLSGRVVKTAQAVAPACSFVGQYPDERAIDVTLRKQKVEIGVDSLTKISSNGGAIVEVLTEKYAAYKLSALRAIATLDRNTDVNALVAMAAAQDLVQQKME